MVRWSGTKNRFLTLTVQKVNQPSFWERSLPMECFSRATIVFGLLSISAKVFSRNLFPEASQYPMGSGGFLPILKRDYLNWMTWNVAPKALIVNHARSMDQRVVERKQPDCLGRQPSA